MNIVLHFVGIFKQIVYLTIGTTFGGVVDGRRGAMVGGIAGKIYI